jgi:hypothetical protein
VGLVGRHDEHSQAVARIAHRGGRRQRGLANSTLADEEADPGTAGRGRFARIASLSQPRLVS